MTKKLLALLLVFVFVFALAACGEDAIKDNKKSSSKTAATSSEETSEVESSEETDTESESNKEESSSKQESTNSVSSQTNPSNSRVIGTQANADKGTQDRNEGRGDNITVATEDLKVTKAKSLVKNLNFKGKTFTMAITGEGQYNTASFKRSVAAFEQQYNCKITIKTLSFGKYNQQVSQAKAAGKPYDICYAHGSMFPACAIDSLYNDLSDSISKEDLMDNDDPLAGGLDLNKSSYFVYNKKLYGTCNFSSCFPYVIYYNKVALAEKGYSGNADPRKLDEKGQWSWNRILAMGKKLTDVNADKYFLSNSFSGRGTNLAFGAPIVTVNNGVYKQNVDSKAYTTGLKMMQKLFVGNGRIAEPLDSAHPYNTYGTMLKGSCYMFTEETSKYLDMAKAVATSSPFNRSKDNIGIVAMPLGDTNTKKAYPTGWLTAVCSGAGKGSNELVAIAWDVFRSQYKDPTIDSNAMSKVDQDYVASLLKGDICCEVGTFETSDVTTLSLTEGTVIPQVTKGADVTQQVTAVKDQMTACIKATLKK